MPRSRTLVLLMAATSYVVCLVGAAQASPVMLWDIDDLQSKLALAIPDTLLDTSTTVRIRNQSSSANGNSAWNVGNSAHVDGVIATDYSPGGSLQLLAGTGSQVLGLNSGNYRPNPAAFNAANTDSANPDGQFQNATTAAAVFGGRIRTSINIATVDVGYLSIYAVSYGLTSPSMPIGGNSSVETFNASALTFGFDQASIEIDGLNSFFGQTIPDTHARALGPLTAQNVATSGTIVHGGPMGTTLTIPIQVTLELDIEGFIVPMSVTGQIVAHLVPEPSTFVLAGVGLIALVVNLHRRCRSTRRPR